MSPRSYARIGTLKSIESFGDYLAELGIDLPCDAQMEAGPQSPLAQPIECGPFRIGNRFAIHPMEGWDGTNDGMPTDKTVRRWQRFGQSGAKLIWGGEAVAVTHDGRANPQQLLINEKNTAGLSQLRDELIKAHLQQTGSSADLVIGLQLTHSGRYAQPNRKDTPEPQIAYRHPLLDRKLNITDDGPLLTDDDLYRIIDQFLVAAKLAHDLGFDFVDIKHCHGYLGHELLSAHTRSGEFGGSFENRTRFLRQIVTGIRTQVPNLQIGVRFCAFDMPPFKPDPSKAKGGKLGPGMPEDFQRLLPYRYGFGSDVNDPLKPDLTETVRLLELLQGLDIKLVNISAGSPYYNPHIQRPALYPPSDGYQPPEDPLVGVARQMGIVRHLKENFPDLILVGTAYTYLQEYLPNVAQAAVRQGWVDVVGLGRMVLSYPDLPHDILTNQTLQTKRICRTFSDCTTAPRNGLVSGCYPLDAHYKKSPEMIKLRTIKSAAGQ